MVSLAVLAGVGVLVCGAVGGYALLVLASFPESCYDVTQRHPDATAAQRELEGLPGVARASMQYRSYDFKGGSECEDEVDGSRTSFEVVVVMGARASATEQVAVIRALASTGEAHPEWRGTLRLELGTDRLRVALPSPRHSEADLRSAVAEFERIRALGTAHAAMRGQGAGPARVRLVVTRLTTADGTQRRPDLSVRPPS